MGADLDACNVVACEGAVEILAESATGIMAFFPHPMA